MLSHLKRALVLLLCAAAVTSAAACGSTAVAQTSSGTSAASDTTASTDAQTTEATLALPALDYAGASFTFGVVDNPNANNTIVVDEQTGDVLNDAQYDTISQVDEKLNVAVKQYVMTDKYPAATAMTKLVMAGDDAIQVGNVFCVDAPTLMSGGYVTDYANIPYISYDQPWWDKNVSDAMMIGKVRYAAIGSLSLSTNDLTFLLVFSKSQVTDNNFASPYDLVRSGKWTMDKMSEMMVAVTADTDGDGVMTIADNYGYAAHSKNAAPSLWIGGGAKSMALDSDGIPQLTMSDERFNAVFNKLFEITWDTGVRYSAKDCDTGYDVPDASLALFKNNRVLFMDCSMFYLSSLRDMDTDFGIIPYPKYDESQENYCVRVSYYMPPIVPTTNTNYDMTGAVLEAANYYAYTLTRPAYYDISLKGKVSRDDDSEEMLDLIMANRVVDLGDTLFCADIRDGFVYQMYLNNNRDLASALAKNEEKINKSIAQMFPTQG